MKKIILACFLTFSVATAAMAGWTETFVTTYQEKGIDQAVNGALQEGKTPVSIIEEGLKIKGLNPQNLLMALYCSGADGNDIKKAAEEAGISDVLLVASYEKSLAECGDQMSDTQAYTPVRAGAPTFAGLPALASNNRAGNQMSDTQAYTPVGAGAPTFAGLPALAGNVAVFASPSTF